MATRTEKAEAVVELRKLLKPGDTVYTMLRHVSRSGMTRLIDVYVIRKGELVFISGYVGHALGLKRPRNKDGLRVDGCGMDMGFHLVYSLGRVLWPKGFKLRKGMRGRNGDTSGYETDGGYALRNRWL